MRADPRAVLGLRAGADRAEIKRAYRRLARELHPDRNADPAAAERLKLVNAAYAELSATASDSTSQVRRPPSPAVTRQPRDPLEATLDGIVGDRSQERPPARGSDIECTVKIRVAESMAGANREIAVRGYLGCTACAGRDARCAACNGEGRRDAEWRVTVEIPAGAVDGTRLRLRGAGSAGRGRAPAGDLLVSIILELPRGWRRTGRDLEAPLRLGALRAALGGRIRLQLPDGAAVLRIPAGAEDGDRLKIAGRGLPAPRGRQRGDLYLRVAISAPRAVGAAARRALRAALDAGGDGETEN